MQTEVFDIVASREVALTVVEVHSSLTPRGLALELQLSVVNDRAIAYWLFEDGRFLAFAPLAKA